MWFCIVSVSGDKEVSSNSSLPQLPTPTTRAPPTTTTSRKTQTPTTIRQAPVFKVTTRIPTTRRIPVTTKPRKPPTTTIRTTTTTRGTPSRVRPKSFEVNENNLEVNNPKNADGNVLFTCDFNANQKLCNRKWVKDRKYFEARLSIHESVIKILVVHIWMYYLSIKVLHKNCFRDRGKPWDLIRSSGNPFSQVFHNLIKV